LSIAYLIKSAAKSKASSTRKPQFREVYLALFGEEHDIFDTAAERFRVWKSSVEGAGKSKKEYKAALMHFRREVEAEGMKQLNEEEKKAVEAKLAEELRKYDAARGMAPVSAPDAIKRFE
jgi:hypothetical protein